MEKADADEHGEGGEKECSVLGNKVTSDFIYQVASVFHYRKYKILPPRNFGLAGGGVHSAFKAWLQFIIHVSSQAESVLSFSSSGFSKNYNFADVREAEGKPLPQSGGKM